MSVKTIFHINELLPICTWQAMHHWTTASKIDLALLDARSSSLLAGKHPWPL
jgi:hypothetical protein